MTEENKKETNYLNDVMVGMHWAGDWFSKEDGNSENLSRKKCASRSALSILTLSLAWLWSRGLMAFPEKSEQLLSFSPIFLVEIESQDLDLRKSLTFRICGRFISRWNSETLEGASLGFHQRSGKGLVEENLNLLLTIKSQFQSQCWAADWEL